MKQIPRLQYQSISDCIKASKICVIQGPRKVGKKTLVRNILDSLHVEARWFDCNDKRLRSEIDQSYRALFHGSNYIVITDAQYLEKLDAILEDVLTGPINATIITICSYIPDINSDLWEALRKEGFLFDFFAPTFNESANHFGLTTEDKLLEERLIYGSYPEVLANQDNAATILQGYLEDVIFTHFSKKDRINKVENMMKMLRILAFNIGDAITFNDIGEKCDLDNETVERYIKLFEKAFILIRLTSYSNDNRYELKKANTVYFTDNGIRNALISNFNPTYLRNDMEILWKNYCIAERIKWLKLNGVHPNIYFWRTHTRQQMDYIEFNRGQMQAFKTDWTKRKTIKFPPSFTKAYADAKCSVVNRSTYWKFLTQK